MLSGSASENICGPLPGGTGAVESAARAWRIVVHHSLRPGACQTIMTRRAPGRRAVPMVLNAAIGSAKNIVPNRLMHTSKCCTGKRS